MNKTAGILNEVQQERARQNRKWGEQNHSAVEWIAIFTEEVGEAARNGVDFHFRNGLINPYETETELERNIQIERIMKYRKECIQVAAVAVAMVESLDRQLDGESKKPVSICSNKGCIGKDEESE